MRPEPKGSRCPDESRGCQSSPEGLGNCNPELLGGREGGKGGREGRRREGGRRAAPGGRRRRRRAGGHRAAPPSLCRHQGTEVRGGSTGTETGTGTGIGTGIVWERCAAVGVGDGGEAVSVSGAACGAGARRGGLAPPGGAAHLRRCWGRRGAAVGAALPRAREARCYRCHCCHSVTSVSAVATLAGRCGEVGEEGAGLGGCRLHPP